MDDHVQRWGGSPDHITPHARVLYPLRPKYDSTRLNALTTKSGRVREATITKPSRRLSSQVRVIPPSAIRSRQGPETIRGQRSI
jgi:hypothetical protein